MCDIQRRIAEIEVELEVLKNEPNTDENADRTMILMSELMLCQRDLKKKEASQ